MSERLKIVRSPVRSRPQPPFRFSPANRLELMRSKFQYLKDKYFDYSMIRWGLVGLTTTAIDFILFTTLYYTINLSYSSLVFKKRTRSEIQIAEAVIKITNS